MAYSFYLTTSSVHVFANLLSVLVAFKKVLSVKGLSATRYAANQFRRVMAQLMSPTVRGKDPLLAS
jgi:hypothetical protein